MIDDKIVSIDEPCPVSMNPRHRPLAVGALRAFEAVARRLSFRAAAEELFLTQPAISRQIRALEDELGTALFLRGTRHVEVTGTGLQLLRSVSICCLEIGSRIGSDLSVVGMLWSGVATVRPV